MDKVFVLPVGDKTTVKILQLTDTHLFSEPKSTLLGVNTYASFHAVLDAIEQQPMRYDLIIATGDLAQDHSFEAYCHFKEGVKRLRTPCVWLPGNHDFQPAMVKALVDDSIIRSEKDMLLGDHWRVLLLDSQVLGTPHGELSDYQLEWLNHRLSEDVERYTLILLHHPPVDSGCTWLDQHRLRNSHMLESVLSQYPNASTLLCGHIHQDLDVMWHGKRLLASPSTCVQFKPHCTSFTLDTTTPGWRSLELYADGSVNTEVHRLMSDVFMPDMDSEGY